MAASTKNSAFGLEDFPGLADKQADQMVADKLKEKFRGLVQTNDEGEVRELNCN